MSVEDLCERIMSNIKEAIETRDGIGLINDLRITSANNSEIWDDSIDEISFYLPNTCKGKKLVGTLKLTITDEDGNVYN